MIDPNSLDSNDWIDDDESYQDSWSSDPDPDPDDAYDTERQRVIDGRPDYI